MKRPLVYASGPALKAAHRLMPGRVLELEVERAILDGRVVLSGNRTNARGRVWGDSWVAHVERRPGRYRKSPRAWSVVALESSSGRVVERARPVLNPQEV